jgi:hypothetical protein
MWVLVQLHTQKVKQVKPLTLMVQPAYAYLMKSLTLTVLPFLFGQNQTHSLLTHHYSLQQKMPIVGLATYLVELLILPKTH